MAFPNTKILSNGLPYRQSVIATTRLNPDAESFYKENESDPGYNITVTHRCDNRAEDMVGEVNMFSTGLIVRPPKHAHMEVFPHPNLYKAGYMLVGPLIVSESEEELTLPLYKYKDGNDLDLPYVAAIAVLRDTEYCAVGEGGKKANMKTRAEREEIEIPVKPKAGRGKKNHMY